MKQKIYFLVGVFLMTFLAIGAQERNCASYEYMQEQLQQNPALQSKIAEFEALAQNRAQNSQVQNDGIIYVPVVVHVVWNSALPAENLSDAQVMSQIDVIYKDFRRLNDDADDEWDQAADMEIEFYLAQVDPEGNPTNGITRKETNVASWGFTDDIKRSSAGGVDPWDTSKYFNFWVGNIGGGILGYASFPGGDPLLDGIVMSPQFFGSSDYDTNNDFYLAPPFDKGRTTTHEIGHYLNLRHIWGDGGCGVDDFVDDTPESDAPNFGCAVGHQSCGSLDMYQNYMDYTDDACMNLFTLGQKNRMRAVFDEGGPREVLNQPPFPYLMDFAETEIDICSPDDAVFTFNLVISDESFEDTVIFSADGLPDGATATFSPADASGDGTEVTLTISGIGASPIGTYDIDILGVAGDVEVPGAVTYNLYNDFFETLMAVYPADGTDEAVLGDIEWSADPNATAYEIDIATDAGFTNIIDGGAVNEPVYTPGDLESLTQYFWRVRGVNDCGSGDYTISSFTTGENTCIDESATDTPVAIPDGSGIFGPQDGPPAISEIEVTQAVTITDVNVTVNITHPWVSDLTLVLTSPEGTELTLSTALGGSDDNYTNTVFDSDASTPITDASAPFTGTFAPIDDLSVLIGEGGFGTWELKVSDAFSADAGTIESWSVEVCGVLIPDADSDGIADDVDNCPDIANNDQSDIDGDGIGDVCDDDIDGDGVLNADDNCPETANPDQSDVDGDGIGDLCDILCDVADSGTVDLPIPDADDNGVSSEIAFGSAFDITEVSVTVNITHTWVEDLTLVLTGPDGTSVILSAKNGGSGDNYTGTTFNDDAEDSIVDGFPPFTGTFAPEESLSAFVGQNSGGVWTLTVSDDTGFDTGAINSWSIEICGFEQDDFDADGVPDGIDNCPETANTDQADLDGDGIGDVCDDDIDGDGVANDDDNCPENANPGQEDIDGDGIGDVCDVECGTYESNNLPISISPDESFAVYEATVEVTENIYISDINVTIDIDHTWASDLQIFLVNPQLEFIELSIANGGSGDNYTQTVFDDDAEQSISSGAAPFTGTFTPEEPLSTFNGQLSQGTWLLGVIDGAGGDGGTINQFTLEVCGTRDPFDYDLDGILNAEDNCVFVENPDQSDLDGDGQGDLCDEDDDGDGVLDVNDNCPTIPNADQADNDGDGLGDLCDDDDDNDGILDEDDNCQFEPNPLQLDADNDGIGNACDDMFPNEVLTPNGDGINDTWIIIGSNRFPNAAIKVYNRWGAEVYSSTGGYNDDWNGSSKDGNNALPTGSYFYRVDQNGDGSVIITGWVYIAK